MPPKSPLRLTPEDWARIESALDYTSAFLNLVPLSDVKKGGAYHATLMRVRARQQKRKEPHAKKTEPAA